MARRCVFDQFISSGERKWLRMSGLVCLLPHGYEGQGPEHSSARLERYLQMCAEDNMQVANCTTPANYFHILRRQLKRDFRKPLILMTPKSLLRHKRAVSRLDDMGAGHVVPSAAVGRRRTLPGREDQARCRRQDPPRRDLCSGKVYYDLYEEREKRGIDDVYLLRIEQLYPFPTKALMTELSRFKQAEIVWCQEEPRNMGGWVLRRSLPGMGAQPDRRQDHAAPAMPAGRPRPRPRSGRCRCIWRSSSSFWKRRWDNGSAVRSGFCRASPSRRRGQSKSWMTGATGHDKRKHG